MMKQMKNRQRFKLINTFFNALKMIFFKLNNRPNLRISVAYNFTFSFYLKLLLHPGSDFLLSNGRKLKSFVFRDREENFLNATLR